MDEVGVSEKRVGGGIVGVEVVASACKEEGGERGGKKVRAREKVCVWGCVCDAIEK